jgi:serine/threonine-protein kinase
VTAVLITASISVTGCTMNVTTNSNPKSTTSGNITTYENANYGFSINYPSDWTKQEHIPNGTGSHVVVLFVLPTNNVSENLNVVVDESIEPSTTLKEQTQANLEQLQQDHPDFKLLESGNTTLAGNPAYKIVYTASANQKFIKAMQVWTLSNGSYYLITYKTGPSNYDKYVETAQQMINSFELT